MCVISGLLLLAWAAAPPTLPRAERLACGLRVVIVEDHTVPLVNVQLWYGAGWRNDPSDGPGLTRAAAAVLDGLVPADALARCGARVETGVEPEATFVAITAPRTWRDDLIHWAARRLKAGEPDLDAVSAALVADRPRAAPRPKEGSDALPTQILLRALFDGRAYGRDGQRDATTPAYAAARVRAHLVTWFAPTNATLLILGDIDAGPTLDVVRTALADVPWRDTPRAPAFEQVRVEHIVRDAADVPVGVVALAWRTPPLGQFENAGVDVLMRVLCNPIDGVLARRLAAAGYLAPRWRRLAWQDAGAVMLIVEPARNAADTPAGTASPASSATQATPTVSASAVLHMIDDALEAAAAVPPSAVALNRARRETAAQVWRNLAGFHARSLVFGRYERVAGDLLLGWLAGTRVAAVTAGDVQAAARLLREARSVRLRGTGSGDRARGAGLPGADGFQPAPRVVSPRTAGSGGANPCGRFAMGFSHEWSLPVAEGRLSNGTLVRVGQLAGALRASVVLNFGGDGYGTSETRRAMVQRALVAAITGDAGLRDYLSYHGIEVAAEPAGVRMVGPADRVDAMIELSARLARAMAAWPTWPRGLGGPRRLVIVGVDDPARMLAVIQRYQADWVFPPPGAGAEEGRGIVGQAWNTLRPEARQAWLAVVGVWDRVRLDGPVPLARRLSRVGRVSDWLAPPVAERILGDALAELLAARGVDVRDAAAVSRALRAGP